MKEELVSHFDFLSKLSIKEYTFYRTWHQINHQEWVKKNLNKINQVKSNLWIPIKPEDYLDLKPEIIIPEKSKEHLEWRILRFFTSSAATLPSPGRGIRVIVRDKITGKYLGIMELASDFGTLKPRDDYIGWKKEIKEGQRMLNYLAMGATIVPTQPLGYNFVGGKLMALLLCCDEIEKYWNSRYPEPVVAFTTTSLFGGFSQYTRLKYWKKCGSTTGDILLEPDDTMTLKLRHWMRDNYSTQFEKAKKASRMKTRICYFCYSKLKVRPPKNKAPRGVYFCELYDNSKKFLNKETDDLGKRKFDNRIDSLVNLWKERYASKRIENLLKNDRYNEETLFYDNAIGMSWDECKKYYIDGIEEQPQPQTKKNGLDLFFK